MAKHQGIHLDNIDDGDIDPQEQEANQMARDWLIQREFLNWTNL